MARSLSEWDRLSRNYQQIADRRREQDRCRVHLLDVLRFAVLLITSVLFVLWLLGFFA